MIESERLLKLAWLLENLGEENRNLLVPVSAFNLADWAGGTRNALEDCGTTACAVGAAMLHPWFRDRGLRPGEDGLGGFRGFPQFGNNSGYHAVTAFFGLTRQQAGYLFAPKAYRSYERTPEIVAGRIRSFVARMAPVPVAMQAMVDPVAAARDIARELTPQ